MLFPVYLILGFLQFFAIKDGLDVWFGIHGFMGTLAALFIAQFPIIGNIVGVYGAVDAWDWLWFHAAALFFGPFCLLFIAALLLSIVNKHN